MGDIEHLEDVEHIDGPQKSRVNSWSIAAESIDALPSSRVILLPARVNTTGHANVDKFIPDEPHLTPNLQFRGRDLKAEKVELDNNMIGLVVKRSVDDESESQPEFTVTNQFSSLYLLHRGATLSDRADVRRAIVEWPKLANALHSD